MGVWSSGGGVKDVKNQLLAVLCLQPVTAGGVSSNLGGEGFRIGVPVVGLGLEKGFFPFAKLPEFPHTTPPPPTAIACGPEVAILQRRN